MNLNSFRLKSAKTKRPKALIKSTILGSVILLIQSCALTTENELPLPPVSDPSSVAQVMVQSAFNPSDILFVHLLYVDDQKVLELSESDKASFPVDPGEHTFKITCHAVPLKSQFGDTPPNLNVVDGSSELTTEMAEGDELCLYVSKTIFNCALLEDAVLSRCEK